jgi:hypothetical protein
MEEKRSYDRTKQSNAQAMLEGVSFVVLTVIN